MEFLGAAKVEKGFVDRQRLDERRQPQHLGAHRASDSRYFAMSDRITTASAQAASALNIGVVERHAVESRDVAAGEHDTTGTAVDDDRPINEVWPVTLLDRGIKGVAVDVGDRQSVECGMADLAR